MTASIRIAAIQCRHIPTLAGLHANPFADDFVRADLWTCTPEAVAAAYRTHKEIQQKLARGEPVPYPWNW